VKGRNISLSLQAFITSANTSFPNNMNNGQLPITKLGDTRLQEKDYNHLIQTYCTGFSKSELRILGFTQVGRTFGQARCNIDECLLPNGFGCTSHKNITDVFRGSGQVQ